MPFKVFITYAHRDREAKDELITRLSVMVDNRLIEIWHDNEILPGDRWRETISNNLQTSDILLYLVSATSLASKNCNKELTEALEKTGLRIVPIILEACDWLGHQISNFQALPDFGKPVTTWEPESDGWQNVVQGIRKVVTDMTTVTQPSLGAKPDKPDGENTAEQFQLANVLFMLGQLDKAVDVYSNIIQLDPQNASAYTNRGIVKSHLRRYEAAIADLDQALTLDPQDTRAYTNRGVAKGCLRQDEAALADLDQALTLDPQYAHAYTSRGKVKNHLRRYEAAIADFDQALTLNPQDAHAYTDRGIANGYLLRPEAAIADYNMALNLDPQNATAYYNRGFIKDRLLGQHEEARADFQSALALATGQGNEELVQLAQEDLNKLPADNSHENKK